MKTHTLTYTQSILYVDNFMKNKWKLNLFSIEHEWKVKSTIAQQGKIGKSK